MQLSLAHSNDMYALPSQLKYNYALKYELCKLSCVAFLNSLNFDGKRIDLTTKARRYAELVCFFLYADVMKNVFALRMTCTSNHKYRRFPLYYQDYSELEANLIEGYLGYDACRFVSTSQMCSILSLHATWSDMKSVEVS